MANKKKADELREKAKALEAEIAAAEAEADVGEALEEDADEEKATLKARIAELEAEIKKAGEKPEDKGGLPTNTINALLEEVRNLRKELAEVKARKGGIFG